MELLSYRREVPVKGHFDVLVCGGGPAGFIAAVASARNGAKTALVERYGFLGGAATASLVNPISTFKRDGKQVIGGIPWEFVESLASMGGALSDYENG
ncbi:MAG: FAD-dependent oxidoreductase, partial [Clostridia bacterium]|nr:FAD-dependent oxidoreductase [Clostridia bacterium]